MFAIQAHAEHQEISINIFYDSQGNYDGEIHVTTGAADDEATSRDILTYYHIKDSNGDTHTMWIYWAYDEKLALGVWANMWWIFVGYDEIERTKDLDLASGHVEKTENTDIVKGKSTEKSNRLNAQPVKTKKLNVNSVLTESSSDIAGNNNPDNTPLKSTTKEKTDYLKSIRIIPSDSSSKVEVYEGGGSSHQDEFDAIRRVESAEFGTRSHYEAIQNLINVLGSSNSPGFRLMASTMMLKDIDGNTITTWEGYQNYAERISQD